MTTDKPEENNELYEHYHIVVDKGQNLLRIDKFLTNRIENVSRTKIQAAADAGNIIVNGQAVKSNYKVKPLDEISIVMAHPPYEFQLIPENIPLDIIYEDDSLVVINKPAGLVVHPGHGNYSGTLLNGLIYHFQDLPLFKSGQIRPGLVHRIDKNTSGILVVAKTEFAMQHLAKQFYDHTINRKYIALVWGTFDKKTGTITGNIARSNKDRLKMAVFQDENTGKHAVTHYKVIEEFLYVTLIECTLETGRTHQIRVHMEYAGHPVFNDERYGGNKILKGTTFTKYKQFVTNCFNIIPRHALHAKSLEFVHPETKEKMFFDSVLPPDFMAVIDKWRKFSKIL
ncbi:MAG: RluA family pseudouridine synthase [Marinilabiliales bacterium]